VSTRFTVINETYDRFSKVVNGKMTASESFITGLQSEFVFVRSNVIMENFLITSIEKLAYIK
jgi:hypothetical protein